MTTRYPTLLLAGKRRGIDPVAQHRNVAFKAIAPIAGRPMISWILSALERSTSSGPVFITALNPDAIRTYSDIKLFGKIHSISQSTGSICRSIQDVVENGGLKPPFLLTTADNAMLTSEMIDHFWNEVAALQANAEQTPDLVLGIVPQPLFVREYPNLNRTFIQTRDEGFKSCNMFAFLTERSLSVLDFWSRIEEDRKKPLKLVRAFGLSNLLRYIFKLDDTEMLLKRAGLVLGLKIAPVRMMAPEVALDVDSVDDLLLVESMLNAQLSKECAA